MTEKGFTTLFGLLEAGAGRTLTDRERDFWRLMLAGDDDTQVIARVREFYRSDEAGKRKERIPAPGDLIARGMKPEQRAELAWAVVHQAVRFHGPHKSITFADPVIHDVINGLGGWVKLAGVLSSEVGYKRAEFVRLYAALAATGRHCDHARLAGIYEYENAANGYALDHVPKVEVAVPYPVDRPALAPAEQLELSPGEAA